jgi:hypothetical protein
MPIDQIYTMAWNRERLQLNSGGLITGTPSKLAALGLIEAESPGGKSAARVLMERKQDRDAIKSAEETLAMLHGADRRACKRQIRQMRRDFDRNYGSE